MGERTRSLVGTSRGVAAVHVYSDNPKTEDGYNAIVFRRDVERSLRKLAWSSEVDVSGNSVPEGFATTDERVQYTKEQKRHFVAHLVEQLKAQYGKISNDDFGSFSLQRVFAKEVQRHALATRREFLATLSARAIAERMVHFAAAPNEEKIRRNGIEYFEYGLVRIRIEGSHYLVMGEVGIRKGSAPYYDQHVVAKFKADSEAPSLQGHLRIGESAFEQIYSNRFRLILQGVELLGLQKTGHLAFNQKNSAAFLRSWLVDKENIVLVTGRMSYAKCGAEGWLADFLTDKQITHLTTVGENARQEDVDEKVASLPEHIDAFIAVGGGTVIDTTKLLRGFSGLPFLAIPTTAGTGAETTRFAVYYDHGKKMSADDVHYLPTDVILIPEFTRTQSPYQRASTEFDAYAQAVESLWAVGATDESRACAQKALDLMANGKQLLGSYWAGRAIDISRTTAAHAFSYYMTATYGIPHGAAVYMMFPAVCRANGHPEFIKVVPELQTLEAFAAERKLDFDQLVEELFANVNAARLGNNPCEVKREHFYG